MNSTIDIVLTDIETAKSDTLTWIETLDDDDDFYTWATSILKELEELETMTA